MAPEGSAVAAKDVGSGAGETGGAGDAGETGEKGETGGARARIHSPSGSCQNGVYTVTCPGPR